MTAFSLIKPKLLSTKNSLQRKAILRKLPFIALGIVFSLAIYIGTIKILSYIRGIEIIGEVLSKRLLSLIFFSLTGFLLLSNIITAISSFYLSRDIMFLASMPIRKKDILFLKTFETLMSSSWMVASFLPPLLIAYGVSYSAPLPFYALTFICLFLFILLSSGVGICLAHALTRVFPAKGMRDILLFISLIVFVSAYFILRSSTPDGINTPEGLINAVIGFKADSPILPHYWLTETLWWSMNSRFGVLEVSLIYITALLANSLFFLMLSVIIGYLLYSVNLEALRPKTGAKKAGSFYPGKNAILYKDIKMFLRDTGQWSQLLVIGALFLIYVYNFKAIPLNAILSIAPFIKELIVLVNMLMAGLILSAVSARFLYSSVSLEGQAFWIIRASPIDMKGFLWGKLIYGSLPITLIVTALVFLTNLLMGVGGMLMIISLVTTIVLSLSISGLAVGLGGIYPRFKYENIASVSMSLGGMTFMVLAFGLVVLSLMCEALPVYLYYKGSLTPHIRLITMVSAIGIITVNLIAFYLPMKIAIESLRKLG
ncbi:MAG: hypothetical protein HY805_01005 [Nitrospirae bacterium]|nr:hypothetical protein [Nitrospirota bacterium]